MALIKKFRIKEFKNKKPVAKLERVSLSYDKRQMKHLSIYYLFFNITKNKNIRYNKSFKIYKLKNIT